MRFFTSDPHLGHARIIELCNRPFADVTEMNEQLIARWNAVVTAKDVTWILGDVGLGKLDESLRLVERLNGAKVLVPGNHDRCHPMWIKKPVNDARSDKFMRDVARYEAVGLKVVEPIREILVAGQWVTVCHFPPAGDSHDADRYDQHRPTLRESEWLLHGHVHEKWRQRGRWINVGVDVWDFAPVPQDRIEAMIAEGPKVE